MKTMEDIWRDNRKHQPNLWLSPGIWVGSVVACVLLGLIVVNEAWRSR